MTYHCVLVKPCQFFHTNWRLFFHVLMNVLWSQRPKKKKKNALDSKNHNSPTHITSQTNTLCKLTDQQKPTNISKRSKVQSSVKGRANTTKVKESKTELQLTLLKECAEFFHLLWSMTREDNHNNDHNKKVQLIHLFCFQYLLTAKLSSVVINHWMERPPRPAWLHVLISISCFSSLKISGLLAYSNTLQTLYNFLLTIFSITLNVYLHV